MPAARKTPKAGGARPRKTGTGRTPAKKALRRSVRVGSRSGQPTPVKGPVEQPKNLSTTLRRASVTLKRLKLPSTPKKSIIRNLDASLGDAGGRIGLTPPSTPPGTPKTRNVNSPQVVKTPTPKRATGTPSKSPATRSPSRDKDDEDIFTSSEEEVSEDEQPLATSSPRTKVGGKRKKVNNPQVVKTTTPKRATGTPPFKSLVTRSPPRDKDDEDIDTSEEEVSEDEQPPAKASHRAQLGGKRKKPAITLPSKRVAKAPVPKASTPSPSTSTAAAASSSARKKSTSKPSSKSASPPRPQATRGKRNSVFRSRNSKGAPPSRPDRYVGDDVFGNYNMMNLEDVTEILNTERPDHGMDDEDIQFMSMRINHWLEDFFVDLCNKTRLPHGFVTFSQLKQALIEQCLLEEDATNQDLLKEMSRGISQADRQRSEGILYPSATDKRENAADTDKFLFE